MLIKKQTKEQGFTLIEMLVSVALFAIVLTVTIGSIITIADANKKARSLMSVMNNLNFSVDAITRSVKTGDMSTNPVTSAGKCLTTDQIDYNAVGTFTRETVVYCFRETDMVGKITKKVGNGNELDLTSPDVDVDYLNFTAYGTSVGDQPRIVINLEGTVRISEKVRSNFTIETTVSQRQLNI